MHESIFVIRNLLTERFSDHQKLCKLKARDVAILTKKLINLSSPRRAMDSKNQIPCLYQFYSERNGKREYKW